MRWRLSQDDMKIQVVPVPDMAVYFFYLNYHKQETAWTITS
ncbi:hypothetical protein GKODMF_08290 [Candidatus Electrothrix gigas]